MAAATAGGTRVMWWPMAQQQQQHVARGSGIGGASSSGNGSGSGYALLKRYPDRLQLNRVLPVAVAAPSRFLVTRGSGMRGNPVLCNGKYELRAVRGSTRAVMQVVEATTAGLRETVEATAVVDGESRSFDGIQTEQELMVAISKEVDSGRLPKRAGKGMEELYRNYRDAVVGSGVEDAMDVVVRVMATVLDRILFQFEEPFTFPSYHPKMTDPYDYYTFGQNYVRPLIDYRNSYLGNLEIFDKIEKNLKEGHNVILLSNHQTEADPAVMALILEHTHPYLAENLTYVAGDRVVLDPFCKPFSMGRNLLCVYSKKHINDVPEMADMKRKANAQTLMQMTKLLKKGGQLLWVAPSGGRDRPDPVTNEWVPAAFDSSAVESMKRLSEVVRVQKELGERRAVGFSGVGLGVSEELDFESIAKRESNSESLKEAIAAAAWNDVNDMYNVLKAAIYGDQGCASSTSALRLAQPWLEESRLRV